MISYIDIIIIIFQGTKEKCIVSTMVSLFVILLVRTCVRLFVRAIVRIRSFVHAFFVLFCSFVRSCICCSVVVRACGRCSFVSSFMRACICSFFRPFFRLNCSCERDFVRSVLFVSSFVRPCARTSVHSFVCSFVHICSCELFVCA